MYWVISIYIFFIKTGAPSNLISFFTRAGNIHGLSIQRGSYAGIYIQTIVNLQPAHHIYIYSFFTQDSLHFIDLMGKKDVKKGFVLGILVKGLLNGLIGSSWQWKILEEEHHMLRALFRASLMY